jgi:hypothetical protein
MDKMNITSARYINDPLTNEANVGILVTIDGQELSVPLDPANRHYSQIMRQVEAGELVIQEAE